MPKDTDLRKMLLIYRFQTDSLDRKDAKRGRQEEKKKKKKRKKKKKKKKKKKEEEEEINK